MNYRGSRGFTIIELVVVIVILGILAAVALPRFMDASERAHDSSVIATKGALGEGVALLKAQWFVNGNSKGDPENDVRDFGDGSMDTNMYGWPVTSDMVGATEWCDTEVVAACATNDVLVEEDCVLIFEGLLGTQGPQVETKTVVDGLSSPTLNGDVYAASVAGDICTYHYLPDPFSDQVNPPTGGERQIVYDTNSGDVTTNVERFSEENN